MAVLSGREPQSCVDIGCLEIRIILKNFLMAGPAGQKLQNVNNPDSQSPNTGFTSAHLGINGNSRFHSIYFVENRRISFNPTGSYFRAARVRPHSRELLPPMGTGNEVAA